MLRLFPHQNMAFPILKRMEKEGGGGFLCDEMGLGKTVTMSVYLMRNKIENKIDLIVCPVSLLEQWKRELVRVYKSEGLERPCIIFFHGKNRVEDIQEYKRRPDYIISTYAMLSCKELHNIKWGRVILDESHYIKNGITNKIKCANGAFKIASKSMFRWCITGTPFNNNINDIASQCAFLRTEPYNESSWWKDNIKNVEAIAEWREKFVLRRTKDDILPPPIYHDIIVTPTEKEKRIVDKLRREVKDKFDKWKRTDGIDRITLQGQILGLVQRLRVASDSFACGKDINIDTVLLKCSKVSTMIEMFDVKLVEDPSNSIVVFSQFTSYLDLLEKIINKYMVGITVMKFNGTMNISDRNEVVKNFTTETYPRILLVSLTAGGCGLNLTPCSTVFLSEPHYNPFLEKQAEERVHRLGQTNQVNIYRLSMNNSVEIWINKLKEKKIFLASSLDLLCEHDNVPAEFSFNNLAELFEDLVGFKTKEKIPTKIIKEVEEEVIIEETGMECSICLEDIGKFKSVNLKCGHVYHKKCIHEWQIINDTCCMCKRPINYF